MSNIDKTFTGVLEKSPKEGDWTYVVWPEAAAFFETHGAVRVRGTVNGEPFTTSFMAMGDSIQMLPINTKLRKAIGKESGDTVTVRLLERLN